MEPKQPNLSTCSQVHDTNFDKSSEEEKISGVSNIIHEEC